MTKLDATPEARDNLPTRQPAGLGVLFFTEMWERFSYYGMRALLVLYLVNSLEFSRVDALQIYATYTMLVYFTPIIGGYIADRWLGPRKAILTGATVMALGHFAMAFPSMLYVAMGLLVVGNGFFKPNISALVGSLYKKEDPRRDGGFTIFYMGINLGAFLSPLICGTLGEKYGWHYGFAAAGVGMLVGLGVFSLGQHRIVSYSDNLSRRTGESLKITIKDWKTVFYISSASFIAVYSALQLWTYISPWWQNIELMMRTLIFLAGLLVVIILPGLIRLVGARFRTETSTRIKKTATLTRIEIHRIIAIFIIAVFVIFFWMGFEQAGGTMSLFADKLTDRHVLGWEIPASYFQSINPLTIILLAPLFSIFWVRLDRSRFALSAVSKQAIGMIILGVGFIVLAIAQQRADVFGQVGPLWLVAVFVIHTIGELFLSPIGLSMVTKLAPTQLVSLMMGFWFAAMAIANFLAGTLEAILINTNIPLYWFLVSSSIGAGLVLLILTPLIHKLMHGIR